jgi:hypothetical protein
MVSELAKRHYLKTNLWIFIRSPTDLHEVDPVGCDGFYLLVYFLLGQAAMLEIGAI